MDIEDLKEIIDKMVDDGKGDYTVIRGKHKALGCRGITCEECWSKEFKE